MPRWLELQAEIDYLHWVLSSMLERSKRQSPIEIMIDKSTGFDKKQLKDAEEIIKKIKKLKEEFYKL